MNAPDFFCTGDLRLIDYSLHPRLLSLLSFYITPKTIDMKTAALFITGTIYGHFNFKSGIGKKKYLPYPNWIFQR